jgi:rSAM/selenodomain-associated transferase 1
VNHFLLSRRCARKRFEHRRIGREVWELMRTTVPRNERASIPDCGIAVMAKASAAGSTKTRLVPPLTFDEAAACNTAFLRDVADNILAAADHASIAGYMAFGPPQSRPFFQECMPHQIGLIDAWYPNFGNCLLTAIVQLLERGHDSAVVLNSDSPTLPTSLLVETAQVLARPGDRAVLGPADDGGYYLLGLKTAHRRLFQAIVWSTEHVARQTLERADELGLPVHILPTWYDVDDVRALRLLQAELLEQQSFAPELRPNQPRHTRALMRWLVENADLNDRLAPHDAFQGAAE